MKFSNKEILKKSKNPETLKELLKLGEEAFRTWQGLWSPFIDPELIEEATKIFTSLAEISYYTNGGYEGAERKKIFFQRTQVPQENLQALPPIAGIHISGNFLFDKAEPSDFLTVLKAIGISHKEIGDIWVIGDYGAQLICEKETALFLDKKKGILRDVPIEHKMLDLSKLKLPHKKAPKKITTVEASKRLDAIASAGFGLSRSKIVAQIKTGKVSINWVKTDQANRVVNKGDRIQLTAKGSLLIEDIEETKKERWRIVLQRE
ncbi:MULTISPECIES: photosystem II S4 domain protein [Prochlorococcus]|uniref:photosystem II S4 domain protein n=1 Tax=Prochlorococcus TaxID=1218 RepID=UPI0005337272|nr:MULTISPECIES: photosystem II S4 domain protein [Prochlorococcus]KGG11917.1 hypothetical protein EV05_1118 [Prochlorococcus sp. MIT 0601]